MNKFPLILILINIISCNNTDYKDKEYVDERIIDISDAIEHRNEIRLSSIADSIVVIPLETTSNNLLTGNPSFIFTPDYIITRVDGYCFDWKGRFVLRLINKGQGPYEEIFGGTSLFLNNYFYSEGTKIIEYDSIGKPTGKMRSLYSIDIANVRVSGRFKNVSDFISTGNEMVLYKIPDTLFFLNTNLNIIDSLEIPASTPTEGFSFSMRTHVLSDYNGVPIFYNYINDTIYHVVNNKIDPQWIVSFSPKLRFPSVVFYEFRDLLNEAYNAYQQGELEKSELIQLSDGKHIIKGLYESSNFIFFLMNKSIYFAELRNITRDKPYIIVYDKNKKEIVSTSNGGFIDDMLGLDGFYPKVVFRDKMIMVIDAEEFISQLNNNSNNERKSNLRINKFQNIKPDDNQILVVAYLKSFMQ